MENPAGSYITGESLHREFHISRSARITYQFDESLFESSGNVVFANFHAVRLFAQKMNQKRDVIQFPEKAIRAGQLNAMGLIDEILHYVVLLFREQKNAKVMEEALEWLENKLGKVQLEKTLLAFVQEYPPLAVYQQGVSETDYLKGKTAGIPHRQIVLEELIMLWLANVNPAFSPFQELFEDEKLEKVTAYPLVIKTLHEFFETQPRFGPDNENLLEMLRSPAVSEPYSLTGQLDYIRRKWGFLIGKYFFRLLRSLDLISEEEKARFLGPGISEVYRFGERDFEPERFSPDKDWMPRVVLIAKSIYVWLDQLSKKYRHSITRLDQIPDEELDRLAQWGFTGLWLIGLWERSKASQRIKQLCGNPEAVASAYSLLDYQIADELGGESAFNNLSHRAWKRGIRMAGDMVPNHMAIDSRWIIEHPDWFLQLDYSPYPAHTYNGPNLSWDQRVGIYVEDHYYNRSDASVVFKRVDFNTGDTKYIYHGNDGTSMPWNDTAQLNYLKPEVREGLIQTILHVARKFPIIRFDAAMTLAKKHFQRLWYPEPGSGGDIPTRAEHGLTREQFDAAMPQEFWREVVDRVAKEIPDTLLLAEAFWLMEGYFVRTLGMHRVYNSAFMNMLKNEYNEKYRSSIKNVLEFNPEILKRFVNFMNNPDEDTAVAQFGKGDKYIGVCIMLVTMPGLPMFGHGQIEGFTEKYGMEYRKAYWDEQPDQDLIQRHQREVFPLMRKRYLFSDVQQFYLYDFYTPEGHVNENVFAYSNSYQDEHGLVIYHNKFENTSGWIRMSAAYSVKVKGEERGLAQKSLGDALRLHQQSNRFTIFREHLSGLEYIRRSGEVHDKGLFVTLHAYQAQVFLEFREVEDNVWQHYAHLEAFLGGRGVPSVEETLKEIFLKPLHQAFRKLVNKDHFKRMYKKRILKTTEKMDANFIAQSSREMRDLLQEIRNYGGGIQDVQAVGKIFDETIPLFFQIPVLDKRYKCPTARQAQSALKEVTTFFKGEEVRGHVLLSWILVHHLGAMVDPGNQATQSRAGMDEWLLGKILEQNFYDLGIPYEQVQRDLLLIRVLTSHQNWWDGKDPNKQSLKDIVPGFLKDGELRDYLQVNRYRDVLWFNKEAFNELLHWLLSVAVLHAIRLYGADQKKLCQNLSGLYAIVRKLQTAEKKSDYQVDKLMAALK
ncbi:MAG: alpha-amylase [bacterium]|nr:MAG: alpha-amylase [bacterium]